MNRFVVARVFVVVATLALSGCSAPDMSPGAASERRSGSATAASGRWADEFAEALRRSTTEFERAALADGVITDGEFAELESAFATCLRGNNVTFGGFEAGGGYGFTPGKGTTTQEANSIADDCSASTGLDTVGYLYFAMQRNPQNLDDAEIIAACLVARGVVPAGYSATDYRRDSQGMAYPFSDGSAGEKALDSCSADPLGLLETDAR